MADIERGPINTTGHHHNTLGNEVKGAAYGAADAYTRRSRIGNPHPLGLISFAATLFIFSLYSVHARGVRQPNVIVGMALFVGGLVQILAGMWAFPRGNTFAATIYSLYGAFWISYATILIPGSGIFDSYQSESELRSAVGIYFMMWMAVTVVLMIGSLKRHMAFIAFFVMLLLFFLFLGVAVFKSQDRYYKTGGAFGIVASLIAFYMGLSKLLASDGKGIAALPLGYIGAKNGAANARRGATY